MGSHCFAGRMLASRPLDESLWMQAKAYGNGFIHPVHHRAIYRPMCSRRRFCPTSGICSRRTTESLGSPNCRAAREMWVGSFAFRLGR